MFDLFGLMYNSTVTAEIKLMQRLPSELVVSVFSYLDAETLVYLRKCNEAQGHSDVVEFINALLLARELCPDAEGGEEE